MKIRNDFVSNSSSCSFVFNFKDTSLGNELISFKGLLSHIHNIFFDWDLHDDAKSAYNAMMQIECIKNAQESNEYKYIDYGDDPNKISVCGSVLKIPGCCEAIMKECTTADTIEFYIADSWGDYATKLVQLLTVLDMKGYIPKENWGDHLDYQTLRDIENEIQT